VKGAISLDILESGFIKGFVRMANDGATMGWHERNGGNLSYRIAAEELKPVERALSAAGEWTPIGHRVPGLADEFFLVTGTGRYLSNIAMNPAANICIAELDSKGERYRICWGLTEGGGPTSEFASHLVSHEAKKQESGGLSRVVYHAHPPNIIAMTFVLPLEDVIFTRELWQMVSECAVVFPKGVGVIPWMVPGSPEICDATAQKVKEYDAVIWPHHGMFATGANFDEAFGLMNTIEKAAEIWIKIKSTGLKMRQTITTDNLINLAEAFKLDLPSRFMKG
jgi:rhamnulose-1-phosphate aldolase